MESIENEIITSEEDEGGNENLENDMDQPFELKWIFGSNPKVPITNLTTSNSRPLLALGSSCIGILYDIHENKQIFVIGHEREVTSISSDRTGQFLMTTTSKCVIIWDREYDIPCAIRVIYLKNPNIRIKFAAISIDGKYVVTYDSQSTVQFWMWSYGEDNSNGMFLLFFKCKKKLLL